MFEVIPRGAVELSYAGELRWSDADGSSDQGAIAIPPGARIAFPVKYHVVQVSKGEGQIRKCWAMAVAREVGAGPG